MYRKFHIIIFAFFFFSLFGLYGETVSQCDFLYNQFLQDGYFPQKQTLEETLSDDFPYNIILKRVKKLENVKIVVIDEANTSKASFLDKDIICSEGEFSGKRISRSQYKSKDGTIFSSDINAAYNILIKGNPFALFDCKKPKIETIDYNITEI